ncbi:MFS transporter [Streptomyces sp. NPDC001508]|uniref:MFS transporter n=1 Tax=Streptomyces sp. NPDC001508 TaxID=3154656 RepID=UPI003326EDE7
MNAVSQPATYANPHVPAPANARRNIVGACIGTFTEYYDIGIYALVAPSIATSFFPHGNPTAATLNTFAIFALGFLARPLGGILFGFLGDRIGRTRTLAAAILLMAASTVAIGVLPTWETAGVLAPLLLLVCRVVQSISVGGEFSGATSYLIETTEPRKRGTVIGILNSSVAIPFIVSIGVVFGISAALSDAAFNSWGWRIPFLLAAPLGIIGLYLRLRLKESAAFTEMKENGAEPGNPLMTGIRTQWRKMLLLFCAAAVTASSYYILSAYMVTYTTTTLGYARETALLVNGAATVFFAASIILGGFAADRFGRRPVILTGLVGLICLGIPSFLLVTAGHAALAVLGQITFAICMGPVSTTVFILAGELFPTPVRYTCNAVSYNFAYAIFGGSAPFVATWLIDITDLKIAPALYTTSIATVSIVILAIFLKETREAELG